MPNDTPSFLLFVVKTEFPGHQCLEGDHYYAVPPRTGEYLVVEGQGYRVKAVLHGDGKVTDLYLDHLGTSVEIKLTLAPLNG